MGRVTDRSKQTARRIVDRVALPYVDRIVAAVASADAETVATVDEPAVPNVAVPSDFFHGILHELRTAELDRLRGSYERVVSVGASGGWYFDWFDCSVGSVAEHVGVEAFEPEPDDLPANVTWIATTADRFDGIGDDEIDMVFAGQTTEHLWADELAGFLLQARRVLRDTGVLVLDSPNRLVSEHLHWSHGGHTVELSPAEIGELVELAGFSVESNRGVWKSRFADGVMGLEEALDDGPLLVRRILDGHDQPDECFVWWLTARPSGEPDRDRLTSRVAELYAAHWPTRVCRGMWPGPGSDGPVVSPDSPIRVESLPFMLRPGCVRVGLALSAGRIDDVTAANVTLALPGGHIVHQRGLDDAAVADDTVWWTIDQPELMFALAMTLEVAVGTAPVRVAMPLSIEYVDN